MSTVFARSRVYPSGKFESKEKVTVQTQKKQQTFRSRRSQRKMVHSTDIARIFVSSVHSIDQVVSPLDQAHPAHCFFEKAHTYKKEGKGAKNLLK